MLLLKLFTCSKGYQTAPTGLRNVCISYTYILSPGKGSPVAPGLLLTPLKEKLWHSSKLAGNLVGP